MMTLVQAQNIQDVGELHGCDSRYAVACGNVGGAGRELFIRDGSF